MKIVSGKTGTPHVTSEQFRQIIEGTVGQGSYILTSGENLEPELASNNMLKIRGGMMSHHGNISCVDLNTYDEVTLTNGSQGVKRIDLIVNRYTRNDETGLEKNEWVVIIGTPDASNPKVPQHTIGNLQNGDLIDDCPVFEVHYDGINVTEVKKLLPVMSNLELLNGNYNLITEHGMVDLTTNLGSKADILASALEATHFLSVISTGGSSTNVPSDEFRYSAGLVLRRTSEQVSIILFGRNNMIATNFWNGSRWTGWKTR